MPKFSFTIAPASTDRGQPSIAIEQWGKDHWSTFAYLETRCVDKGGSLDFKHMRCDRDRHPQFSHLIAALDDKKYPTMYKGGGRLENHDDWDCLDDCEIVGLCENVGTGINRVYILTALGRLVAAQLRAHKAAGFNFNDFEPRM